MGTNTGKPAAEHKVPAVTKAIAIVRYINRTGAAVTLNDICAELRFTKSHCFNILKALTSEGWLTHDDQRRVYELSPGLLPDVSSAFSRKVVSKTIHQEMENLSTASEFPCLLTRIDTDSSFIVVDRSEPSEELMFTAPIGHRFPPDAPAQMCVRLAWLPIAEQKAEIARWKPKAYTATTIINKKKLLDAVIATHARGYGISRGEYTPGIMTFAAPDLPPLKWSSLKYDFQLEDEIDGKEEAYGGRDRREASAG